jgi:hypothetical protein
MKIFVVLALMGLSLGTAYTSPQDDLAIENSGDDAPADNTAPKKASDYDIDLCLFLESQEECDKYPECTWENDVCTMHDDRAQVGLGLENAVDQLVADDEVDTCLLLTQDDCQNDPLCVWQDNVCTKNEGETEEDENV